MEYKLRELEIRQKLCVDVLRQLPQGGLSIYRKNDHVYYNTHLNGVTRHLAEDDPLLLQLKDRHLVQKTLCAIEEQIKLLKKGSSKRISFDPNELLAGFPEAYKAPSTEIFQAIGFEDARVWAQQPYARNQKHPENLIVRASNGLMVRSRIEAGIVQIYIELGIPFRYDELLILPSGEKIYTDFHPLLFGVFGDRRHEHFGMLTDPHYRKNEFLWKNDRFLRSGIEPQTDVLYTFDGPNAEVDIPLLRQQILDWIRRCREE